MNISRPFILRPIGSTLLALGLFIVGFVAYRALPVASLPAVEFPTISVSASRPGADPETMAATIASPLERRLGEISGVNEMTSVSSLGSSRITLQFDLSRSIDGAARDVQAALNAAARDLPGDLPVLPRFRKINPSAAPILILALTSDTMAPSAVYDAADTVLAQRIMQVPGVAEVQVAGAEQPAIRVRVDPSQLASMGVSMEEVRRAITNTNAVTPIGQIDGPRQSITLGTNEQLKSVEDYRTLVVKTQNGDVVRLSSVAAIEQGPRNTRSAALFNLKPAVLLPITKQADANVIETVDAIKALIPELKRLVPNGIEISILSDRTTTLRASIDEMLFTLSISIVLVMLVVFVFLRRSPPTIAAGVTVPLSLAGTCAVMWLAGFSINNLTLMAIIVSVGFVVDDAIVMIENIHRRVDSGERPMQAALKGSREIGFTVLAISISLLAAFIPLLFLGGIFGRLLREFSMTLAFAIIVSTIVSLTITPMITAHFLKHRPEAKPNLFDRVVEGGLGALVRGYARTLKFAIANQFVMLFAMLATIVVTVHLYVVTPKGLLPQDDTGLMFASLEAPAETSFEVMAKLQRRAVEIVLKDPAVARLGSTIGTGGFNSSANQGRIFIALKPLGERGGLTTSKVGDRLRKELARVQGLKVFITAAQDVRVGARQGKSTYQLTLWSLDIPELYKWVPQVVDKLSALPELVDVANDREQGGFQLNVLIDRDAAARVGVNLSDIESALNNAFAQRQISTLYTQRNQYRVVLEVDPALQRQPSHLARIHVPSASGTQVPLSTLIRIEEGLSPLVVNHQGPFPAVTITYNVKTGVPLQTATEAIDRAVASMALPENIRVEAAGEAKAFAAQASAQPLLIIAALVAVYIVLGVLYESLAHPLTIISTLPSAGLGALLALQLTGRDLNMISLIGVILLIGIVKKNGIMLVDFALAGERERGLAPEQAIHEACVERFRPILMTTLAAVLGALPLALSTGPGSELRLPLGVTIIGGLVVSQILTLYTTPAIYLLLDRLHRRLSRHVSPEARLDPDKHSLKPAVERPG